MSENIIWSIVHHSVTPTRIVAQPTPVLLKEMFSI